MHKIFDVNEDNIVISRLVETKNNSNHLIWYLVEVIRPLVLILSNVRWCVKAINDKGRDKDQNNKLRSLCIDNDKLLNALPVYDNSYIKNK